MLKLSVPCAGCESTLTVEVDGSISAVEQDQQRIVDAVVAAGWEDCGDDALCDECSAVTEVGE